MPQAPPVCLRPQHLLLRARQKTSGFSGAFGDVLFHSSFSLTKDGAALETANATLTNVKRLHHSRLVPLMNFYLLPIG